MEHKDDAHGGHGNEPAAPQHSTFYRRIAIAIVAVFAVIALFRLIPSEDVQQPIEYTRIATSQSISIPDVVDFGHYKHFILAPGVTLQGYVNTSEAYLHSQPPVTSGWVMTDDEGNPNIRYGSPYLYYKNSSTQDLAFAVGRCKHNDDDCNIDFTDPSLEQGAKFTMSPKAIMVNIRDWIIVLAIIFMIYFASDMLIAKYWPKLWLTSPTMIWNDLQAKLAQRNARTVVHTTTTHAPAHSHGIGHGHHHDGDKNGINLGFVVDFAFAILLGIITLYSLWYYDGLEIWFVSFPAASFGFFAWLIDYNGFIVDTHKKKGIYSKYSKTEKMTFTAGDAYARRTSYDVGTPPSQGLADMNLDNKKIPLLPKNPEQLEVLFKGKKFASIQQQWGILHPTDKSNTSWMTNFEGGTFEDIEGYVNDFYYSAITVVAATTDLDKLLTKTAERTLPNGTKVVTTQFCIDVDAQVNAALKGMGILLDFYSGMGQPKPGGVYRTAIELDGALQKANATIKKNYPGLSDSEREIAARVMLSISKKDHTVVGIDMETMDKAVQMVTAGINAFANKNNNGSNGSNRNNRNKNRNKGPNNNNTNNP